MKKVSILGSTGSIGINALSVIDNHLGEFDVIALSANKNGQLLIEQALKYQPEFVAIVDTETAIIVEDQLSSTNIKVLKGRDGLLELSSYEAADLMLNALVGSSGMEPTINALKSKVDVALSNKESLVMAGNIINDIKNNSGAKIFPVDSEHSAIWQCLTGESMEDVNKIILTGSGGPFRTLDRSKFSSITPEQALKHPNWDMGNKITIDSATMMNKGLEVIEAFWLFNISKEMIEIIIHPESIIHSMVEFKDKSIKAQLGLPDMKIPIQYALTFPNHPQSSWKELSLTEIKSLTFEKPDYKKFPCMRLAFDVLEKEGSAPAVLNVANEQAVYRFLKNEISFNEISHIIEMACDQHNYISQPTLDDLLKLEIWSTDFVKSYRSKN
ncbi:MAG: 1-deoxy-D-xylulose-5-phosphate reductoisomerase [Candidatus Neomarinimicrobiota bacterium]|nr:1-deoxy-D-xylulose-5-phosphate reductoisomerase [Candidatus Neomarinimicrobiota bacterium]MEC7872499.1 1-deoxy-D-xylulose-5-phosphate reductoisomerase [Candidatus Neomarinimicrobiota bacterium]MEC9474847.1 1-deoxy-D-xylulose-5-phosphate reductoisomerase [Candidatus Neomarinimicrobiota bacterium]MED5433786.1 1-deoxy-D-xylulose-5-phosphate reductoisomerase [Candidatus Neomarinimicrobiota bacterium]MEE3302262.1 1-deoxy-D-xylulose-5-phosphate reductoisomerase [Candidatus Neomarinimicrobiota bact|tara:strand:- start:2021 stop:3175 length:1155 start_codon:yes stop_codon:yes gene_type:complete